MKKLFVLFAATILVAALVAPAMAADWKFYGSARVSGWSVNNDNGAGVEERNTRFQLQNNTRLGSRVSGGKIYGRFEFGINPDNDGADNTAGQTNNAQSNAAGTGVYTRLLYGVWDFGAGKLLVGKDYTPEYLGISTANQAGGSDSVMLTCGVPYAGRRGQIRLEFGGLHIALVDDHGVNDLQGTAATTKVAIPKIAASYDMKLDPISLTFAGSYLSYDVEQTGLPDLGVDAYYVGARATVKLGPIDLKGTLYYAQNGNELGLTAGGADGAMVVLGGTANAYVVDNDTIGYAITGTYKLSDMVQFQAGYGRFEAEMDDANAAGAGTGTTTDDDRVGYYIQSTITLAKGVFIVPEIGVIDFGQNNGGGQQGDNTYYGAKFQINF